MEDSKVILTNFIIKILNCNIQDILQDDIYLKVKEGINLKVKEFLVSQDIKDLFCSCIEQRMELAESSGKSLKEVLPEGYENTIKVFMYNKIPDIRKILKSIIHSKGVKKKIQAEVGNFLNNLNPLISKIINGDIISSKLIESLSSYVDDDKNMINLIMIMGENIDKNSNSPISDYLNYIPYQGKQDFINKFADLFISAITQEEVLKKLEDELEKYIVSLGTLSNLFESFGIPQQVIINKLLNL